MSPAAQILSLVCWFGFNEARGEEFPPSPPSSPVWDDTRAFSSSSEKQLGTLLTEFSIKNDCDFWVAAVTGLSGDTSPREVSRGLRRRWSPDRPAFLLLYSRGNDASSISVSPEVWQRYPSANLIAMLQRAGVLLGQKSKPLEQRLSDGITLLIERLTVLESVRQKQSSGPAPIEQKVSLIFAACLSFILFVAALIGWRSRATHHARASALFFPSAKSGKRLGASFGGGVVCQTDSPLP